MTFLIMFYFQTEAQITNPQNQFGIDYASSVHAIKADLAANRFGGTINETMLNHYSDSLNGLDNEISLEAASSIISMLMDSSLNLRSVLFNSRISDLSKETLFEIITNPDGLDSIAYKSMLASKVSTITNSRINSEEKQFVCSALSILYNNVSNAQYSAPDGVSYREMQHCYLLGINGGDTYEGTGINWECAGVMAVLGGVLGYGLCGWGCAAAGFLIGGVLGALS